mgnify:CR=1 FL=1
MPAPQPCGLVRGREACGVGTRTGRGWRFVSGSVVAGLGAGMGRRAGWFPSCSDRGAVWGHQRPGAALNTPAPAPGAAPAVSAPRGQWWPRPAKRA